MPPPTKTPSMLGEGRIITFSCKYCKSNSDEEEKMKNSVKNNKSERRSV
jgi:hypothetical protein